MEAGQYRSKISFSIERCMGANYSVAVLHVAVGFTPMPEQSRSMIPVVAVGVAVLLWASAFIAIRTAGRDLSAPALTEGRLIVGSIALGIMVLVRDRRWPRRQDWPLLILCGVVWFGIYNLALNEAERHLDAGTSAMVVNTGPILIALLAGTVLSEGYPRRLVSGVAVAFSGVIVIGLSTAAHAHADVIGVVLCLISAMSYAVGVLSQKPVLKHISSLTVTWVACTIGALVCLPFTPVLIHDISKAQGFHLWLVAYLGIFPTAVAFTVWSWVLSRTTAGRMGVTTYLVPPITILMSWTILGEGPGLLTLAGGLLCLFGVYLARR